MVSSLPPLRAMVAFAAVAAELECAACAHFGFLAWAATVAVRTRSRISFFDMATDPPCNGSVRVQEASDQNKHRHRSALCPPARKRRADSYSRLRYRHLCPRQSSLLGHLLR